MIYHQDDARQAPLGDNRSYPPSCKSTALSRLGVYVRKVDHLTFLTQ